MSAIDENALWGANIELPTAGVRSLGHSIDVIGWVLGRRAPALAIEILHAEELCCRVPVDRRRPDVEQAYPHVADGGPSGFATSFVIPGMAPFRLTIRAVLRDHSRVPLGIVRVTRQWWEGHKPLAAALVSVVIPCFHQAHYLADAIQSVLAQTYSNFEIVVVDDGSTDNTQEVASRYPGVRYIRQPNRGPSAARNAGLRESRGAYLVFLDADDRLLPGALETGLRHLLPRSDCAFAAGRHRVVAFDGSPLWDHSVWPGDSDLYRALLRRNFIAMQGAVMYQRFVFQSIGGFDVSLRSSEDYDVYLRIARRLPIHCHDEIVAEYRRHGTNMTTSAAPMLRTGLRVLRGQRRHVRRDPLAKRARREGMAFLRAHYGGQLVNDVAASLAARRWRDAVRGAMALSRLHPGGLVSALSATRLARLERPPRPSDSAPAAAATSRRSRDPYPGPGEVDLGSLRRLTPISRRFGYDRGLPVDRYYIEDFLTRHASDVRGRVMEVGDAAYTIRFGGARVTRSDVLHVNADNAHATIIADLARGEHLPSSTFDCVILTQTLHLIYDVAAAVRTLSRILKPGGVLLATVPGTVTQIAGDEWCRHWNWGFTRLSLRRLVAEAFPENTIHVEAHGNVLVAVAALHGLAASELTAAELAEHDPQFEVLLTVRAVKAAASAVALPVAVNARHGPVVGPVILLYHRIATNVPDPWGLCVSPTRFDEHLDVIRRHVTPLSLRHALDGGPRRPRDAVVVTFDDGYADNLHHSRPLLERYDVPATVFVATGYVGSRHPFWWDELARHVLEPDVLPETLTLVSAGDAYHWRLGDGAMLTGDARARFSSWRAWHDDPTRRHYLYRSLWAMLRDRPHDERRRLLDQLAEWARTSTAVHSDCRPLTADEVGTLAACDLIDLGCHTRTHPRLATLDPDRQRDEIVSGKRELQDLAGYEPRTFAYPYGSRDDYTETSITLVRASGFDCACASVPVCAGPGAASFFELPRLAVGDWDGDEFARRLSGWLNGRW